MFNIINTLDELRKAYRAAAFAAHPDHDGTDRHKAIADAKEYQRTHTGIAVTVDIAKGKFEH